MHLFIRATTWARRNGRSSTVSESFLKKVSWDELRTLKDPDVLTPQDLRTLGFSPEKYQFIAVLRAEDDSSRFASTVSSWIARKSRWPWSKKLQFRSVPPGTSFAVEAGELRPI